MGDHEKLRTTIVFSYDLAIIDCYELQTGAYKVLIPASIDDNENIQSIQSSYCGGSV